MSVNAGIPKHLNEFGETIIDSRGNVSYYNHHMLCKEDYPWFAGEPNNLQYLNEYEHYIIAHLDNHTKIPTNWYVDVSNGTIHEIDVVTVDFQKNSYGPMFDSIFKSDEEIKKIYNLVDDKSISSAEKFALKNIELSIDDGNYHSFKYGLEVAEKHGSSDIFAKIGMQSESEMLAKYNLKTGDLAPDEVKKLRAFEVFESRGADLSGLHSHGLLTDEQLIAKYELKVADADMLYKYRSFEFLTHNDVDEAIIKRTGVLRDTDIISKYSFLNESTDKSVLNFYREAEFKISKGKNPADIMTGSRWKDTYVHYDADGKFLGVENNHFKFSGKSSVTLTAEEARNLPTDSAMRSFARNADSLNDVARFEIKCAMAKDPTTRLHFDADGNVLGFETSKVKFNGTSALSLTADEARRLPTDDAMKALYKDFDSLTPSMKFSLKHADSAVPDEFMREVYKNFDDFAPELKASLKQAHLGLNGNADDFFKSFDLAKELGIDSEEFAKYLDFKNNDAMEAAYRGFSDLSDDAKKIARYDDWLCGKCGIKNISEVSELSNLGSKIKAVGKITLKAGGIVFVGGMLILTAIDTFKNVNVACHSLGDMINQYKEVGKVDPTSLSRFISSTTHIVSTALNFIPVVKDMPIVNIVSTMLDVYVTILETGTDIINYHLDQIRQAEELWDEAEGSIGPYKEYHEYLQVLFALEKKGKKMTAEERAAYNSLKSVLLDIDGSGSISHYEEKLARILVKSIEKGHIDPELLEKYIEEECYSEYEKNEIRDYLSKYFGDEFDNASNAQPPRDPLVIDLGEKGIELTTLDGGTNFDLDNNGFKEKTAWIGNEDGFLVFDKNGDGIINNGSELFGDQMYNSEGVTFADGFDALAYYDKDKEGNADGKIDDNDLIYDKLKVWIDANGNGETDKGELKTLKELGIVSIGLDHEQEDITDDFTGTRKAETGKVEIIRDGKKETIDISEFWFPVNTTDTVHGTVATMGNVPDINTAIENDETGKLGCLYRQFCTAESITDMRYYLKKILYFITDAESVNAGDRGGNIDARDLKVVESFIGRNFEGVSGANPNAPAAQILKNLYINIENYYLNTLINEKYLGNNKYPQIIDENSFKTANEKRVQKATSVCIISEDLQEIRNRTYCSECGHRLSRISGNCRHEKWDCRNPDCYRLEYQLTDQMIIGAVLTVLNTVIANSSLIENNCEISVYSPTADVIRKQNEINQMMDSARHDFDRIKSEIFKLSEMKYDCCTYNENPQKTAEIKAILENHEQLNTLNIGLFKACISRILISHFCTIEVEFINGATIKNITERTDKNAYSSECQDNSCTATNSGKSQ